MRETLGHRKYRAFIEKHGISKTAAGRAIGVTHSAICGYLDGTSTPAPERRPAIAVWTNGEVPEQDWLSDEERERAKRLAEVQPFVPPTQEPAA